MRNFLILLFFLVFNAAEAFKSKFAFFGSFSSDRVNESFTDTNLLKGVDLFFKNNPKIKNQLEYEVFDYKGDVQLANKLLVEAHKKGFRYVVGIPKSNHVFAIKDTLQRLGMILITPQASHPDVFKMNNVISVSTSDKVLVSKLVAWVMKKNKAPRVLLLTNTDSLYSQSNSKVFEEVFSGKGISLDNLKKFNYFTEEMRIEDLKKIFLSFKPDYVFIPDYASQIPRLVEPLDALNSFGATFIGSDGWGGREFVGPFFSRIKSLGYYSYQWHVDMRTPLTVSLKSKTKNSLSTGMTSTYDSLKVLSETLSKIKNPEDIVAFKSTVRSNKYELSVGSVTFGASDSSERSVAIIDIDKGAFKLAETF